MTRRSAGLSISSSILFYCFFLLPAASTIVALAFLLHISISLAFAYFSPFLFEFASASLVAAAEAAAASVRQRALSAALAAAAHACGDVRQLTGIMPLEGGFPSPLQRVAHPAPGQSSGPMPLRSLDSPATQSGGSAGAGSFAVHSPSLSAVQHSGSGSGCAPHSPRPLWLAQQSRVHNLPVFTPELAEPQEQSEAQIIEAQLAQAQQAQADRTASDADGRPLAADSDITAASSAVDGEEKDRRDGSSVCVLPPERDD